MTTTIWQDNLSSLYASDIASDATLTPTTGSAVDVRIMDKTEGVIVGESPGVETILPVAVLMMATLTDAGIDPEQVIDGATLTIDGKNWTVSSHRYKPSPDGEKKGEIVLLLKDGEI